MMHATANANGSSSTKKHRTTSPQLPEAITAGSGVVVALHCIAVENGPESTAGVVHPASHSQLHVAPHCSAPCIHDERVLDALAAPLAAGVGVVEATAPRVRVAVADGVDDAAAAVQSCVTEFHVGREAPYFATQFTGAHDKVVPVESTMSVSSIVHVGTAWGLTRVTSIADASSSAGAAIFICVRACVRACVHLVLSLSRAMNGL